VTKRVKKHETRRGTNQKPFDIHPDLKKKNQGPLGKGNKRIILIVGIQKKRRKIDWRKKNYPQCKGKEKYGGVVT